MMLRQRTMAAWLRTEYGGYPPDAALPAYRQAVPGHMVARSPHYGWIPAPVDDAQRRAHGHADVREGVKWLEQTCAACKKGSGKRMPFDTALVRELQAQINLEAELAVMLARDDFAELLHRIRSVVYLWSLDLVEAGLSGEHNTFDESQRKSASACGTPEHYCQRAQLEKAQLPVPGVRDSGFFDRLLNPG